MNKVNNINKIKIKYSKQPKDIIIKKNIKLNVIGRVILKRLMGINNFFNIQDIEGEIQILINKNKIEKKLIKKIKKIKIGDIILINGFLYKTNTNELTIKSNYFKILTKNKKLLPDKFHKLKNKKKKNIQRYLDLIINSKTRKTFLLRIKIINIIRKYLNKKNFLEVETPMLHNIPGGASAKPFITYHNKLNKNIYLRIAPELYLKKLIIGGFTKIFELNRNFRNEGLSYKHNPEFTMIEIYKSYSSYKYMMNLIQKLIYYIIKNIYKNKSILIYQKKNINFNIPYKIINIKKSIYKYSKLFKKLDDLNNEKKIKKIAKKININFNKKTPLGKIINKIFEITTEKKLIQPTFITEYPIDISPLAKKNKKNKKIADRFELFIGGYEIANGFTELNNYKDQKKIFKKQINKNKKFYDKEYINALKYGLPKTSGIGIGIDRLVMLLTNSNSIKDVILFPTLNKK